MATSRVTYLGELRTQATHIKSGVQIITDAPPDNHGKGEAFSPTDLMSTSLASCMMTLMGIAARTHQISFHGAEAEVTKIMGTEPRRVVRIEIDMTVKGNFSDKEKQILEKAAHTCPVSKSLHPDIEQAVTFTYA